MLKTKLSTSLGLKTPIISAGMAFVAGPALAAAVTNAGGLGMLGGAMVPPEGLRMMIRATRSMTKGPFGVDLIGTFAEDGHIDVLIEENVPVVVFFWAGPNAGQIARLKEAGIRFWMQVGRMDEARDAVAAGVEALIIQGSEAGGHNRAEAPLAQLLPRMRREFPTLDLIAAGGIIDGASMAAALCMGAEAVWCGTRFLASVEANAHPGFKQAVIDAGPGATEITTVFGPEWPGQELRALKNKAVDTARGRVTEALRAAEGEMIGKVTLGGQVMPVPRYSAILPTPEFEADLEWACLTAGECASEIQSILPAAHIVRSMSDDAEAILNRLAQRAA